MQPVHPSILPSRLGSLGSIRAGKFDGQAAGSAVMASNAETHVLGLVSASLFQPSNAVPSSKYSSSKYRSFRGLCMAESVALSMGFSPQMQFHRPNTVHPNTVHFALSCDLRKTKRDLPHKPNQIKISNQFKRFLYQ